MIRACVTRTAVYHLHLSWEEQLGAHALPLQTPGGMTRVRLSRDQSCSSGIHATPSDVCGSSVCTAPQSSLLGRRSQLTLPDLLQTRFVHVLKELKVGFSAKAHGLTLSIDNCSCAASGWHRVQYKFTRAWTALSRCTQRHSAQVTGTSEIASDRSRYTVWPSFKSSAIYAQKGKRKSQHNYYFFPDRPLTTFFLTSLQFGNLIPVRGMTGNVQEVQIIKWEKKKIFLTKASPLVQFLCDYLTYHTNTKRCNRNSTLKPHLLLFHSSESPRVQVRQ